MTSSDIYSSFCNFIDAQIFSEDNIGTSVAFIVDRTLINEFCKKNEISEKELMWAVRANLYSYTRNITHIKGILAIQLYAASKRANTCGITAKNYLVPLSQVLDLDMNDLQRWMKEYQEMFWETFYSWCDSHFFYVAKCKRKTGPGKYVQYPLMQSLCIFTEEDLKYIAYAFIEGNLQPGEDITEREFWRNVSKDELYKYFRTSHSREVRVNSRTEEDYLRQIFNYYLRWNGEYKFGFNSQVKKQEGVEKNEYLYLNADLSQLQIRNSKLSLLKHLEVSSLKYNDVTQIFNFKHKGLILFKKDDVYDGFWQETRYLENGEEGIAIIFNNECSHRIIFNNDLLIKKYANVSLYIIRESFTTQEFYTQKRYYSLEGGLKVGRLTYLFGAGPTLNLTQKCKFWIDGKPIECSSIEEGYDLSNLSVGEHTIRFPNFKKIEFEIVAPQCSVPNWLDKYNKWIIGKDENLWDSDRVQEGIVGLDFTVIPQTSSKDLNGSVLERWGKAHQLKTKQTKETNIAIQIISNLNI